MFLKVCGLGILRPSDRGFSRNRCRASVTKRASAPGPVWGQVLHRCFIVESAK